MSRRLFLLYVLIGVTISVIGVTHRTPATTIHPEPEVYCEIKTIEAPTESIIEDTFKSYDFIPLSAELQTEIYKLCNEYHIPYNLALAVIKTESEFIHDIIGDDGNAVGLCQIWTYWWGDLADERGLNIYEPADNVELMLIILNQNLDACEGELTEALQMYNTGEPYGNSYASRVFNNLSYIESEVNNYGN